MNELNMLSFSDASRGYKAEHFVRDQDLFFNWVRKDYPECLLVGLCIVVMETSNDLEMNADGIVSMMGNSATTEKLMVGYKAKLGIYSYNYYNGISDKLMPIMP